MHVFALGYLYTCEPILRPVIGELRRRGIEVSYRFEWESPRWFGVDFDTWLTSDGPRVLLLAADEDHIAHQRGTTAIARAHLKGIPSVSVQHGAYTDTAHFRADVVCLWSLDYALLVEARHTIVTGNPALDQFPTADEARQKVKARVGLDAYTLLAGSRHGPDAAPVAAYQAAIDRAQTPVVVRPHPAEIHLKMADWYADLHAPHGLIMWPGDTAECGLPELYSGAREVIGQSTVLIEAQAAGVPVRWIGTPQPAVVSDGRAAWRVADVVEGLLV